MNEGQAAVFDIQTQTVNVVTVLLRLQRTFNDKRRTLDLLDGTRAQAFSRSIREALDAISSADVAIAFLAAEAAASAAKEKKNHVRA